MPTESVEGPGSPRPPRRRVPTQVVAFLGVLCAGVLIGWVVFRNDDPAPATSTAPAVAAVARIPGARHVYPRLGLVLDLPKGWHTQFRRGVLNAASGDDKVSVAFSLAGNAAAGPRVRRSDRAQLLTLFKARELGRRRAKVGGATTVVTELTGQTPKRQRIRILSMGPSSRWQTYSIQVFTVPQPAARRLAEVRSLLASVGYRQPT